MMDDKEVKTQNKDKLIALAIERGNEIKSLKKRWSTLTSEQYLYIVVESSNVAGDTEITTFRDYYKARQFYSKKHNELWQLIDNTDDADKDTVQETENSLYVSSDLNSCCSDYMVQFKKVKL